VGDKWGSAHLTNGLGDVARREGAYDLAAERYEASLAVFRESRTNNRKASALHNLGYVALHRGDPERAEALFVESLTLFRDLGDGRGVAECLAGLAGARAARGRAEQAARLFGASEAALESMSTALSPSNLPDYEQNVADVRAALDPDTLREAWTAGRALSLDQAAAELGKN
jgi:tetratricopeptide (TPR) repeat protein